MAIVLQALVLASPFLWLISVRLLRNWRYFWLFFALNSVLLLFHLLLNTQLLSFGHDEYGLARLSATIVTIVVHTILGFFFAVLLRYHKMVQI